MASSLGISIPNLNSVINGIKTREKRVDMAAKKSVKQAALMGERMERKLVRKKTHALENSIDRVHISDYEEHIKVGKWYGIIIERGSKPHLIIPKSFDGYLYWKGAKHPVRSVQHPGTKPYPFVKPTYEYLRVYYPRLLQQNIKAALD